MTQSWGFSGGSVVRIRLPLYVTQVQSLVQKDSTCRGATKPIGHIDWPHAPESVSCSLWSPNSLEPMLLNTRSHHSEKLAHHNRKKPAHSNKNPAQPEIIFFLLKWHKHNKNQLTIFPKFKVHLPFDLTLPLLKSLCFPPQWQHDIEDNSSLHHCPHRKRLEATTCPSIRNRLNKPCYVRTWEHNTTKVLTLPLQHH